MAVIEKKSIFQTKDGQGNILKHFFVTKIEHLIGGPLGIDKGGTRATSAAEARENLEVLSADQVNAALSNKAPSGYGLGSGSKNISNQDWLDVLAQNTGGWYSGSNVTNAPTTTSGGVGWYTFIINPMYGGNDYQTCIAIHIDTGRAYIGRRYAGTWRGWLEIGTVAAPTWYAIAVQNGFTNHESKYCKTRGGVVHLSGAFSKSAAPVANETIMTLPEGFRPDRDIVVPLVGVNGWATFGYLMTSGHLVFAGLVPSGYTPGSLLGFNISFSTAI